MNFGIVSEGPSDFLVLEAIVKKLRAGSNVFRIHPGIQSVSLGAGWTGVKRWCEANGPHLERVMRGIEGREIDRLIVHVDCSMAHNFGIDHPCPPPTAIADDLQRMVRIWLNREPAPNWLTVVTPSKSTTTWAVAALCFPSEAALNFECAHGSDKHLVKARLIRSKNGRPVRDARRFEELAPLIAAEIDNVCVRCTEAARFRSAVVR